MGYRIAAVSHVATRRSYKDFEQDDYVAAANSNARSTTELAGGAEVRSGSDADAAGKLDG